MILKVDDVYFYMFYYSHVKALLVLNQILDKPIKVRAISYFDGFERENNDDEIDVDFMAWSNFRKELVCYLTGHIGELNYDDCFRDFINEEENHIADSGSGHQIFDAFYFDQLYDNLHLLDEDEKLEWIERMKLMFNRFPSNLCSSYHDYYSWAGDFDRVSADIEIQMQFKYVFFLDYEYHDNPIEISIFKAITELAVDYISFENELKELLEKKRQVKKIA